MIKITILSISITSNNSKYMGIIEAIKYNTHSRLLNLILYCRYKFVIAKISINGQNKRLLILEV